MSSICFCDAWYSTPGLLTTLCIQLCIIYYASLTKSGIIRDMEDSEHRDECVLNSRDCVYVGSLYRIPLNCGHIVGMAHQKPFSASGAWNTPFYISVSATDMCVAIEI